MIRAVSLLLMLTLAAALQSARAQDDTAAERARLGNVRIQAEAERRLREEEERLRAEAEAGASRSQRAADPARSTDANTPRPAQSETRRSMRMSRMLDQLRTLGELKDAGYVTEREFQRIKRRILEGEL